MTYGYREFQSVRIEPGPHGPETHIHIDRRKLGAEEAARFMSGFSEAVRDPRALFENGSLFDEMFGDMLTPDAKAFIDQLRERMGPRR